MDHRVSLPRRYFLRPLRKRFPEKGLFTHRTLKKTPSWHALEFKLFPNRSGLPRSKASLQPKPPVEYFSEEHTFNQQNPVKARLHREKLLKYLEQFPPLTELPSLSQDYRLWGLFEGVGSEPLDPRFRVRRRGSAPKLGKNPLRQLRWFGR